MNKSSLTLCCYPRLHLGLLDTGGISKRVFGGAGFSLDAPPVQITAYPAQRSEVSGALSASDAEALRALLEASSLPAARILVEKTIPRHVGLGSGTLLSLGTLAAANYVHDAGLSADDICKMSGRGGASGVGIHSFWRGGFLVDAGQPNIGQPLLPSGSSRPIENPPLTTRIPIPPHWKISLLLPRIGSGASGSEERLFFSQHIPTPRADNLTAFPALFHSIAPAIATGDLALLRDGLADYQAVGLKKAEISRHGDGLRRLTDDLQNIAGCAFGMSSLGPLIFTIYDQRDDKTEHDITTVAVRHGITQLHSRGRNFGHTLVSSTNIRCTLTESTGSGPNPMAEPLRQAIW